MWKFSGIVEHVYGNGSFELKVRDLLARVDAKLADIAQSLQVGDEITIRGRWASELNGDATINPLFTALEIGRHTSG